MQTAANLAKMLALSMALAYSPAMAAPATCQIENAHYLTTSITPEALCQRFEERLIAATKGEVDLSTVEIMLNVTKGNAIHAILTHRSDKTQSVIPDTSVEVMDRELRVADLDDLAEAVGEILLSQGG